MNLSETPVAEVPPGVLTVRSTVPADSAGEVAEQLVVELQLIAVDPLVPNLAVVAPTTKPVPVTVTTVAPLVLPTLGPIALTTGAAS